ncbi:mechanosensitive ion channel [Corynebacterium diphtheriae]|nr:mechanosensitive ion channel [Corynebacterium diphtheriae]
MNNFGFSGGGPLQVLAQNKLSDETESAINSTESWLHSPMAQDWLIERPIRIALTLVVAIVLNWALRKAITKAADANIRKPRLAISNPIIKRKRNNAASEALTATQEQRRQARIRTLAAVGRSAVSIFVWVWAALGTLKLIGVDVTPLIASAGVVGVALGFGAQSLVKDFLSGVFMLIEDQYGVGDTIDVGDVVGAVEDVSLRLTTLRDINGTQWFVRNGEILRVGNFSQEYAVAIINVPIALDEKASDAIALIEKSVADEAQLQEVADVLLDDPVVDGVNSVGLDHMVIRTRVTTLPDQQWFIERKMRARILTDLQRNGIDTPYPEGIGAYRRLDDEE